MYAGDFTWGAAHFHLGMSKIDRKFRTRERMVFLIAAPFSAAAD
jgi:hypothetical protein